jgi:hypothetical protein
LEPLRCDMCGKPAERTSFGSLLCDSCRGRYAEFVCARCAERVCYLLECSGYVNVAAGLCSQCDMADRLATLSDSEVHAIRAAASRSRMEGVKEARARLGWSVGDAVDAVHLLLNGWAADQ